MKIINKRGSSMALNSGKEVRVVFCDISKASDRVWHNGLIHN
jgi:hypothetical protein